MPTQKPVSHLTTALRSVDVQCTLSDPLQGSLVTDPDPGWAALSPPRYIPNRTRKTEPRSSVTPPGAETGAFV